jgi:hypothetical protein
VEAGWAPIRDVFLMKMYRGLPNDHADMVTMWPHTGFTSAQDVVVAFWAAYPHAPVDPYPDQFVREIAARAGVAVERSS